MMTFVISGCAYRFSNISMNRPSRIKSVAVEAVYDSSKNVIPSEVLWMEVQKAIAALGKVKLTTVDRADAILLTHISSARGEPLEVSRAGPKRDPKFESIYSIDPGKFRDLLRAGSWTNKHSIGVTVEVSLVDLRNREEVFHGTYGGDGNFFSISSGSEANISLHFLRFEESRYAQFRAISKTIAGQIAGSILF